MKKFLDGIKEKENSKGSESAFDWMEKEFEDMKKDIEG